MAKSQSKARPGTAADRQAKIDAAKKASASGPNKILIATVVAVLAIVAVVGAVVYNSVSAKNAITQGGTAVPAGSAGMGKGWSDPTVKPAANAPVVTVFEDFRCPVCQGFEQLFGQTIEQLAKDGKIHLRYVFKTVIDANYGSTNSQQAASNALCAADAGVFKAYHDALFANQPQEPNQFTKEEFTKAATTAGLSGEKLTTWQACADAGKYMNYVKSTEDASFKAGVTGTPSLYLGDTPVSWGSFLTADKKPDTAALTSVLTSGTVPADKVEPKLPKVSSL